MYSTVQTGHAKWIAGYILTHAFKRITKRDSTLLLVRVRDEAGRPLQDVEFSASVAALCSMVAISV